MATGDSVRLLVAWNTNGGYPILDDQQYVTTAGTTVEINPPGNSLKKDGCNFQYWSLNDVAVSFPYSYTVNEDMSLTFVAEWSELKPAQGGILILGVTPTPVGTQSMLVQSEEE